MSFPGDSIKSISKLLIIKADDAVLASNTNGGAISISSGFGGNTAPATGGSLSLSAGDSNASGAGGTLSLNGGANNGGAGYGGLVYIAGGLGNTTGGNVQLVSGASNVNLSGNILIDVGVSTAAYIVDGYEPQISFGAGENGGSIYIGSKDSTLSQLGNHVAILQKGYGNLQIGSATLQFTPASTGITAHTIYDHTINISNRNVGGATAGSLNIVSGANTLGNSGNLNLRTPPSGIGEGSLIGNVNIIAGSNAIYSLSGSGHVLIDGGTNGTIGIGTNRINNVNIGTAAGNAVTIGNPLTAQQIILDSTQLLIHGIFSPVTIARNSINRLVIDTNVTVQAGTLLTTTGTGNINLPNNVNATFQIEGVPVNATVTTGALNVLTLGAASNADGYHTHAIGPTIDVQTAAGPYSPARLIYRVLVVNQTVAAAYTVNLPASPTSGDIFNIKDGKGDAATNNITIQGNGKNIDGSASLVISMNYGSYSLIYNGTQWNII